MINMSNSENIIHSRPSHYRSVQEISKPNTYWPIFGNTIINVGSIQDVLASDGNFLSRRFKYRKELGKHWRNRFWSEYFGLRIQRPNKRQWLCSVAVEYIVFVGADIKKRINWTLGHAIKLILGKDKMEDFFCYVTNALFAYASAHLWKLSSRCNKKWLYQ